MSLLVLAARLAVAAVLVWAGVAKLLDPTAFADEIANYRIVPALSPFFAATLPSVEVVTGLALLVAPRAWRAAAALLAVALLAVFTAAVASAWRRGLDIRCGCFGTGGGPITGLTVLRDLGLLAAAAAALRAEPRR